MNSSIRLSEILKERSEELLVLLRLLETVYLPAEAKANLKTVEKNLSACLDIL